MPTVLLHSYQLSHVPQKNLFKVFKIPLLVLVDTPPYPQLFILFDPSWCLWLVVLCSFAESTLIAVWLIQCLRLIMCTISFIITDAQTRLQSQSIAPSHSQSQLQLLSIGLSSRGNNNTVLKAGCCNSTNIILTSSYLPVIPEHQQDYW